MIKAADMHCDTIMRIYQSKQEDCPQSLKMNNFQIDQKKLETGKYLLQNFALFIDKEEYANPYQICKEMVACFYEEMKSNSDWIRPVTRYEDILANQKMNKISALLTMEEGAPLCGEIEKLIEFYELGVRMLTLTWNYPNEIGYPNAAFFQQEQGILAEKQLGLTSQGIQIVQKMEELGMIIDVSHGSDQLVEDVLSYTTKPFVASHSNARSVCTHFRNLPDHLIKKIADRGGVIGINYYEEFLRNEGTSPSLTESVVAHIEHFRNTGGIECIGLGSDFDGIPPSAELPDASSVSVLFQALERAGYSDDALEKIFQGNVLRLYKECLR